MTWLETWVGVLLGLVLLGQVGRDALRQATASLPETLRGREGTTLLRGSGWVPTWLLALLVLLTLGPRLAMLLV
ncbi:MAG: hypothetical protein ACTHKG_02140 [Nocardioides sp.]